MLLLAHANGFRLNTFLFSLFMLTCGVGLKAVFDVSDAPCNRAISTPPVFERQVLAHGLVSDLSSSKMRVLMVNVCFCGTFLLWPLVVILHFTEAERLDYKRMRWSLIIPTAICALSKTRPSDDSAYPRRSL